MGVDYRNVIMYGKEFDSFEFAMQELLHIKVITEDEFERYCNYDMEYYSKTNDLSWNVYSEYAGGEGVLGMEVSARTLYTQEGDCYKAFAKIDEILGNGCELHEFVKVY